MKKRIDPGAAPGIPWRLPMYGRNGVVGSLKIILLLLMVLAGASCATTGKPAYPTCFDTAPLLGMIYGEDGAPVQGMVVCLDTGESATSDVNGRFFLPDVRKGVHTGTAGAEKYETIEFTFSFMNRSQILYLKAASETDLLEAAEKALEEGTFNKASESLARARTVSAGPGPEYLFLCAILAWKRADQGEAIRLLEKLDASCPGIVEVRAFLAVVKGEAERSPPPTN